MRPDPLQPSPRATRGESDEPREVEGSLSGSMILMITTLALPIGGARFLHDRFLAGAKETLSTRRVKRDSLGLTVGWMSGFRNEAPSLTEVRPSDAPIKHEAPQFMENLRGLF